MPQMIKSFLTMDEDTLVESIEGKKKKVFKEGLKVDAVVTQDINTAEREEAMQKKMDNKELKELTCPFHRAKQAPPEVGKHQPKPEPVELPEAEEKEVNDGRPLSLKLDESLFESLYDKLKALKFENLEGNIGEELSEAFDPTTVEAFIGDKDSGYNYTGLNNIIKAVESFIKMLNSDSVDITIVDNHEEEVEEFDESLRVGRYKEAYDPYEGTYDDPLEAGSLDYDAPISKAGEWGIKPKASDAHSRYAPIYQQYKYDLDRLEQDRNRDKTRGKRLMKAAENDEYQEACMFGGNKELKEGTNRNALNSELYDDLTDLIFEKYRDYPAYELQMAFEHFMDMFFNEVEEEE